MMRFLFPPVGHIINVWSEVYFLGLTWRGVGTNLFQDWDGKFSLATSFKEADHELCLWTLPIPNHCQTLTVAQHKYIASLIDLLIWILKKSKCPISKSLIIVFFFHSCDCVLSVNLPCATLTYYMQIIPIEYGWFDTYIWLSEWSSLRPGGVIGFGHSMLLIYSKSYEFWDARFWCTSLHPYFSILSASSLIRGYQECIHAWL